MAWHYPRENLDLGSADFVGRIQGLQWHVFWGDSFRSDTLVAKHASSIREFFRLPENMRAKAKRLIFPCGKGFEKVVLVHIRQGDYATWAGGKYCFSETVYARWMREFQAYMEPVRFRFVICSQFPLDYSAFAGLNFHHQPRDLKEDFAMIQCADYCLATISSFARTACFLGSIPLAAMADADAKLPPPNSWQPPSKV